LISGVAVRQREGDVVLTTSFKATAAPCGRIEAGESYEDRDEEALVTEERDFACGCRTIRHEYHDGSVSQRIVRHDGTVLLDELDSAE
jgi:hypothetical protein